MELVVAVAIGVLAAVFVAALITLVVVLKHKCKKVDHISEQHNKDTRQDAQLIVDSPDVVGSQSSMDVELGDVQVTNPRLEELLNNHQWVDDATGLVPHCLHILKICHHLTEKLVGMTMGTAPNIRTQEMLNEIVPIAKRINPRLDDAVRSINPPLDPRLLEARFTALMLSVSHLVMITKNAYRMPGTLDWIDESLADVEGHLRILREASSTMESHHQGHSSNPSSTSNVECQGQQFVVGPTQARSDNSQL